jgi:hypothetical protein
MEPQQRSWTCSICAYDWLLRASGLDPWSDRIKAAYEIGYPSCVDEWSGLKDTYCLVNALEDHGVVAVQEWVDWPRAYELAGSTAAILNSTSWFHFVAVRGQTTWGGLWIANSAMGYGGIADTIDAAQWAGKPPWQMVYLVR